LRLNSYRNKVSHSNLGEFSGDADTDVEVIRAGLHVADDRAELNGLGAGAQDKESLYWHRGIPTGFWILQARALAAIVEAGFLIASKIGYPGSRDETDFHTRNCNGLFCSDPNGSESCPERAGTSRCATDEVLNLVQTGRTKSAHRLDSRPLRLFANTSNAG
jgi:hypothetical protein